MQTQEAIKTYLLKKKSNTKLDIFLFLSEHRFFITTQYLADHFHMSESNFLLYIKELEQDFERLNLTELHIDKQKPFLKLNFEGIDPAYCYYRLFGRYCNESVSYEISNHLNLNIYSLKLIAYYKSDSAYRGDRNSKLGRNQMGQC